MSKEQTQEYRGNGKHNWEIVVIDEIDQTQRLRVPGGWLYSTFFRDIASSQRALLSNMVFVPRPKVVKHKV